MTTVVFPFSGHRNRGSRRGSFFLSRPFLFVDFFLPPCYNENKKHEGALPPMNESLTRKPSYFSRDPAFYKAVFRILLMVALQNIINYSVNMADNIMLGSYRQEALSGSTVVGHFFFVINSFASSLCSGYAVLGAQYWGKRDRDSICRLGGAAFKVCFLFGCFAFLVAALFPTAIVSFFTTDPKIIEEGVAYLSIVKYTYLPYCVSLFFMELLRSVETVHVAFCLSISSLLINVGLNWFLIFGRGGFPAMGVRGAAVATLIARGVELLVLVLYLLFRDKKLRFFASDFLKRHASLARDYARIVLPILLTSVAWSIATPMQSAILGHVSSDAIAANSIATTFYQYLKVIALAMSAASSVVIGKMVGKGDFEGAKAGAHSLEIMDLAIGITLAVSLFLLRKPLLTLYTLTPETEKLADDLIKLMCLVMVFMSYEVPVMFGSMKGAGDTRFSSFMNIVFVWVFSLPMAFLSAFVWHWGVVAIVACIQSDQAIKCIPAFLRFHCSHDKWIHKLTRD